jgi:DNA-directed RNA polymerase I, II, and III subunit RPABC3
VTRIVCRGENYDMDLVLDYNTVIYKLPAGQKFNLVLARTLNLDGTADSVEYNQSDEPNLADNYEYVMPGRVFKVTAAAGGAKSEEKEQVTRMEVYASYGGLLMSLKGNPNHLQKIELDMRIYLLIRRQ